MRKLFLLIILVISFLTVYIGFGEESTGWMPKWNVGDWWEVAVYKNYVRVHGYENWGGPYIYRFSVKEEKLIDNIEYMIVEADCMDNSAQAKYVLYCDKSDLALIKSEYYPLDFSPMVTNYYFCYYKTRRPILAGGGVDFSIPLFPFEFKDNGINIKKYSIEESDEDTLQKTEILQEGKWQKVLSDGFPKTSKRRGVKVDISKVKKPSDDPSFVSKPAGVPRL